MTGYFDRQMLTVAWSKLHWGDNDDSRHVNKLQVIVLNTGSAIGVHAKTAEVRPSVKLGSHG